jgi:hypothetical protein
MINVTNVKTLRNSKGVIKGYLLRDKQGTVRKMGTDEVKKLIRAKQLNVINLTLTSDGRLVKTTPEVKVKKPATAQAETTASDCKKIIVTDTWDKPHELKIPKSLSAKEREWLLKMRDALSAYDKACDEILSLWLNPSQYSDNPDFKLFISGLSPIDYPYHLSFDEIDCGSWVGTFIRGINKALQEAEEA